KNAKQRYVTRASAHLDRICGGELVDLVELEDAMDEFDRLLSELDVIQEEYELTFDNEELDAAINEYIDYKEAVKTPRLKATKILKSKSSVKQESDSDSIVSTNSISARLPKIVLPNFSGDVKAWLPFWDQFKVLIHETALPAVTKFTYLTSVLKGEAKACIQGLSLTEANYNVAVNILSERFGKKEIIIASHIDTLLNIDIPPSLQTHQLWEILDMITSNVRSLENLGISGEQYGALLTPIILSRMPQELRLEWAR
ncbi:hypothetical protein Ahia01_001004600, partial [Argonauta hians]